MLKHYVEFFFPGVIVNERRSEEVTARDPKIITVPENSFGFRFFDRTETVVDGELLVGEKKNFSPITYFGEAYTLEEVRDKFPEEKILISNMERNHWNRMLKTRTGNWKLLEEDDIVVLSVIA